MAPKISKKLKKEVKFCEKGFSCLKNGKNTMCKVVDALDKKVLFVEKKNNRHCNYRILFGKTSAICTCPIRKEIHFSQF